MSSVRVSDIKETEDIIDVTAGISFIGVPGDFITYVAQERGGLQDFVIKLRYHVEDRIDAQFRFGGMCSLAFAIKCPPVIYILLL